MEYEYLLRRYTTVTLRPAYRREIPLSIRGFLLPREYTEFISQHDGASLMFDASVPDLDDVRHVELFSLHEIMDGTGWNMHIMFEKGDISSGGYMAGPDKGEVLSEILKYLRSVFVEIKEKK